MNNTKSNTNAMESNTLMRKTKAQLVDIIFRKDDVERNLRADIKGMEKNLQNTEDTLIEANTKINLMQNDYKDICDEKVYVECKLNNIIKKQKQFIYLLAIALCISIVFNLLGCI